MVKKLPTKDDLRAELDQEMEKFLSGGGEVAEIPRGTSGKQPGDPPTYLSKRLFVEPAGPRTLVPEVVAAIEARRRARIKRQPVKKSSRLPRPRRKIIYDDFGEPLRRVWIDE